MIETMPTMHSYVLNTEFVRFIFANFWFEIYLLAPSKEVSNFATEYFRIDR